LAFQLETKKNHYTALSTDVKTVAGVLGGSTCTELDTGDEYIHSGTAWVQKITQTEITGSLANDTTLQSAAVATGNGTNVDLGGACGLLTLQVKGITNATVTFEVSNDAGTTWVAIRGINQNTGNGATTTTSNGIFRFSVGGVKLFRARISAWVSGAITVLGTAIAVSEPANQATTTTGTVAIDQATPGTTNNVTTEGKAAHDAVASGNPVQVGGVYRVADPAVADGDSASLRVNAKGEAIVQLSGRKHTLPVFVDASQVLNVAAAGSTSITITPPAGELWKILNLYVSVPIPSGGGSGTHTLVLSNVSSSGPSIISGNSVFGTAITLSRGYFSTATTPNPTLPADQQRMLHRQRFSNASPLAIVYLNDTNVTQTGTITIKYVKEVEYIVA
jgi:hypothetical protein